MSTIIELQKDISAEQKAIRQLIGERAAKDKKFSAQIKRLQAKLKLQQAKLRQLDKAVPILRVASRFPDVSNNNRNVDVQMVRTKASGVRVGQFMVTKMTEGTGFKDPDGPVRAKQMSAAQFPRRGFYAFLHPGESGVAQAQFFLNYIHSSGVVINKGDILIGDGEVTDGQPPNVVARCFADFGAELRKHFENERWLYGGGPFFAENGVTLDGYDEHWLPAYVTNPVPFMVFGAARTKAWQYTDGRLGLNPHVCPGIGPSDMSVVLR